MKADEELDVVSFVTLKDGDDLIVNFDQCFVLELG